MASEEPPPMRAIAATESIGDERRRLARRLGSTGHIPGIRLAHLEFRVLSFLLVQDPGPYAGSVDTIAEACASDPASVAGALERLGALGLVANASAPLCLSTPVCGYSVQLPRLGEVFDRPSLARATPPRRRSHPAAKR